MEDGRTVRGSEHGWNTGTTHEVVARHDWDGRDSLAVTIVEATSQLRGEDGLDLPPLADVVDPDSLERLFRPLARTPTVAGGAAESTGRPATHGRVQFQYAACEVTVWADGMVIVAPA